MNAFLIGVLGLVIVFSLAWLIRKIFAPQHKFSEFLVGDNEKYSLSRLQATLWAFVIVSYQVSTIILLFSMGEMDKFELVFSDQTIWLLGLSMGSYVISKGIGVSQINDANEETSQATPVKKKISNFITGQNGLDLSRFQMLVWTIIAISIFVVDYFGYLQSISQTNDVAQYFPKFGDETGLLPSIDMSFIVLMGLSQGTYIGRKLVPAHKAKQFTTEYKEELTMRVDAYTTSISSKEAELEIIKNAPTADVAEKKRIENEIEKIKKQKTKTERELADLKSPDTA